jgi:oligopeptide/dipeptide ABC transporter ATP-binding protein
MYAGRLMEYGDIQKVFMNPHHPYTMGLQGAFPNIKELKKSLVSIPGSSPLMVTDVDCCGFTDRCPFAIEKCKKFQPEIVELEENHYVSCHRYQSAHIFRKKIGDIFGLRTRSY